MTACHLAGWYSQAAQEDSQQRLLSWAQQQSCWRCSCGCLVLLAGV